MSVDAITPMFGQTHRFDAFLQHDLLCRLLEPLIRQPAPVRLRPSAPAARIAPLVTQQDSLRAESKG